MRGGQLAGGQRAIGKIALLSDVQVAHHLPVGPFKIPQHRQGLAHAAILEYRFLHVEHIALGRLRHLLGQVRALQAAIVQGRAVVADGVTGGGEFTVEIIGAAA